MLANVTVLPNPVGIWTKWALPSKLSIISIHSAWQSLSLKPPAGMCLLDHGGLAADRGMGKQRFRSAADGHEVRPLDQAAIPHIG